MADSPTLMSRARLLIALLLAVVGTIAAAPVVHAQTYMYDAPLLARVYASSQTASAEPSPKVSTPLTGSVGPSTAAAWTSTTRLAPVDATNTAPDFEFGTFVNEAGVKVTIHPGDHPPPHAHVVSPGMKEAQIGQNGKPLDTSRPLTAAEEIVIERNLAKIRSQVDKFMRWYKVCG